MTTSTLCENDIGKRIILTVKNSAGTVVDVTGASITFRFKRSDGSTLLRTGTVRDGPNGLIEYQFVDGDLLAGHLQIQITINITGSTVCSKTIQTRVWDAV